MTSDTPPDYEAFRALMTSLQGPMLRRRHAGRPSRLLQGDRGAGPRALGRGVGQNLRPEAVFA
jgi:hypothetical protein